MSKQSGIVNIRGKDYQTVAYRVSQFREKHPDWTLITEIVTRDTDCVVMRATISDEALRVRATGHAEEYRKSSQINRTSALENCETSAIGRALACAGFGGTEFASADEVAQAIKQQGASGIHKPTDGAMDHVAADRQKLIVDAASEVSVLLEAGSDEEAYRLCERFEEPDEKVALWSLLDSKQRRRIKDQAEIARKVEHASQA